MIETFLKDQSVACKMVNKIVKSNNVSHAYLIETNNYYRGFDFALSFAKTLLCPENNTNSEHCGKCTQCFRIDNKNFSELEIIEPDGVWIKKEQLDALQKKFSTKSLDGGRKVYIINHAEKLNQSSSNSILKFLEEPEDNIVAILIVDNSYSLLDTIVSRCQAIKLNDVRNSKEAAKTKEKIAEILFNNEIDINNFINNDESDNFVSGVIDFIKNIEKQKLNVVLKENQLCSMFLNDKLLFDRFINVSLLFYKDCLDYLVRKKISIFNENNEDIVFVAENNESNMILKKIEILTKMQERIKYNCNLNLVLDKLIILLGGV